MRAAHIDLCGQKVKVQPSAARSVAFQAEL
jgi:hypothetical protein